MKKHSKITGKKINSFGKARGITTALLLGTNALALGYSSAMATDVALPTLNAIDNSYLTTP